MKVELRRKYSRMYSNLEKLKKAEKYIKVMLSRTIPGYNLIAHIAEVSKQLVVVLFAVCQSLLLIMTVTVEWLLTFGTHEMLQHKRITINFENLLAKGKS